MLYFDFCRLNFEDVGLSRLPRETRLCLTLCGVKNLSTNPNANDNTKVVSGLGSVTIQLYNSKG